MLDPNSNYVQHINQEQVKIAEIYDVTLANGDIFKYTSHSKDIEWNGTYVSIPITRSEIAYKLNSSADDVTISIGNITGGLFNLLMSNAIDAANIVIKRVIWSEPYAADMELLLFQGTADLEFDRQILVLHCRSILDSLNIKVPKNLYQEECNNRLFDALCTLTQSDFVLAGTVTDDGGDGLTLIDDTRGEALKASFDNGDETNPIELGDAINGNIGGGNAICLAISYVTDSTGFIWYVLTIGIDFIDGEVVTGGGNTITIDGTPAEDTMFWALGEVEFTDGNNDGYRRMILSSSDGTEVMAVAFPNEILSGDNYNIYPGCDKRAKQTCREKFSNEENYKGDLYLPKIEETIM